MTTGPLFMGPSIIHFSIDTRRYGDISTEQIGDIMENCRKYGEPPFRVVLLHGGPGIKNPEQGVVAIVITGMAAVCLAVLYVRKNRRTKFVTEMQYAKRDRQN